MSEVGNDSENPFFKISSELPGTWLSICMLSVISLIQIWGEISDFDRPHLGDYSRHSYQLGCEFKSRSAKFEYTEGPCLMWLLVLKKSRISQNLH